MKTMISRTSLSDDTREGDPSAEADLPIDASKTRRRKIGYYSLLAALPAMVTSQFSDARAEESGSTGGPVAASGTSLDRPRRISRPAFPSRAKNALSYQKGGPDLVAPLSGNDNCPGNAIPGGTYTSVVPYTDTGDTTGANDTVSRSHFIHYSYYWHETLGPDHVYTFTMTSRGENPRIEVTRSSGTYEPSIYILDGRFGCPAGTGQSAFNEWVAAEAPSGGSTATLEESSLNYVPLNIPLHLFVDSRYNDARGSGPYTIRMQDVTVASTATVVRTKFDFDADSRADVSVFRPSDSVWYLDRSTQGITTTQFGLATDKAVPADYDGDGRTDIAIYRDGTWWWINSSDGTVGIFHYGTVGDSPVPADFSSDGRAELVVYRGGQWYQRDLATGAESVIHFGTATDKPVVADYDGDGRADQAVYRNGQWHLNRSRDGYRVVLWGNATDIPVVGDYEGDGKADLGVYRNGEWWINGSLWNYQYGYVWSIWGNSTDVPVPADYDGDAYTDIAVFRDGLWWVRRSTGGIEVKSFGLAGDKPLPAAYLP